MCLTKKTIIARFRASIVCLLQLFALVLLSSSVVGAQQKKSTAPPAAAAQPKLTRKTSRHEVRRFGYGSTLTILGAPAGSITIEAWPRSEVDITADIELSADTEEDLALLSTVNGFVLDADANRIRILTTGTHDKAFMKRAAKNFPKKLLGLPWKIDYRLRVPAVTDMEIDAGRGPVSLNGVEGAISLNALESDVKLNVTGGLLRITVGAGKVDVSLVARSWRGAGADVRLAIGDLTLELPAGYNGDINADILRTGKIENEYSALEPCERTTFTPRSIKARAGAGGPQLSFTVGDGTLRIKKATGGE